MKEIYDFLKACPCYFIATMIEDNRVEAKKAMLDDYPSLRAMYDENDENTAVWYMTNAKGSICSFTTAPKEFCF